MRRIIVALCLAAAVTAVAQDTEMTPEQQAAKCAAEGGCALFTRDAFMGIIRAASEAAYRQGVQLCTKTI